MTTTPGSLRRAGFQRDERVVDDEDPGLVADPPHDAAITVAIVRPIDARDAQTDRRRYDAAFANRLVHHVVEHLLDFELAGRLEVGAACAAPRRSPCPARSRAGRPSSCRRRRCRGRASSRSLTSGTARVDTRRRRPATFVRSYGHCRTLDPGARDHLARAPLAVCAAALAAPVYGRCAVRAPRRRGPGEIARAVGAPHIADLRPRALRRW